MNPSVETASQDPDPHNPNHWLEFVYRQGGLILLGYSMEA